MNLILYLGGILLNLIVVRFFHPYAKWPMSIHVSINNRLLRKNKMKTAKWLGGIFCVLGCFIVWIAIEGLLALLQDYIDFYSYAIELVIFAFALGIGQILNWHNKTQKGTENKTFIQEQLKLLLTDADANNSNRFPKLFFVGNARYIAERVLAPLLIGAYLGADFLLAYLFLNYFAVSDIDERCTGHGYASAAIWINRIITWPAYGILYISLKVIYWLRQRTAPKPLTGSLQEKCAILLQHYTNGSTLTAKTVKKTKNTEISCIFITLAFIAALYLFVMALLAAAALDIYWDFWNGTRNGFLSSQIFYFKHML